jgi:hypothetical protein
VRVILARANSFGHARMNYGLTTQQRQMIATVPNLAQARTKATKILWEI